MGVVNIQACDHEFLRALHDEKIRAQNERANYVTRKLAFVTVLFGLSSLDLGLPVDLAQSYWLLYFVPLVAICYDSYIMSADARVKRIGAFLGRHPGSVAGDLEKQWEVFSARYRSGLAPLTDLFLSILLTVAAAIYLYSQQHPYRSGDLSLVFATWFAISMAVTAGQWIRHRSLLKQIDGFGDA